MPLATSSTTPRSRAATSSGSALPSSPSAPPNWPVQKWLRISPFSRSGRSSRVSDGETHRFRSPICTISGRWSFFAVFWAVLTTAIPSLAMSFATMRILTPLDQIRMIPDHGLRGVGVDLLGAVQLRHHREAEGADVQKAVNGGSRRGDDIPGKAREERVSGAAAVHHRGNPLVDSDNVGVCAVISGSRHTRGCAGRSDRG